ncbi:Rpn family recombination-promoting nuclease/putative transposase [Oscillatoria salina]|uniref:Rpn family recombination-promoting nuclease/putative transposase n=1 Tax=Oscillatoria salina TaxID=331517 RepID=UPI001CC97BA4|nr:Rpn family recombination-promoting nuclease/putative transposase [Oscillatoria salina]MBZ8181338.1 Rpn family recombination-promoting nuclease/putative transposase [Oscillatoria salina IIICB1]
MKTDTLFYELFKNFPSIFFELIGKPDTDVSSYQFTSPEVKQKAFRFDGLFLPIDKATDKPIYFVEVQFQKQKKFYSRLFSEIFLYFYQYEPPSEDWYVVIIYRRRSTEAECHPRYQNLLSNHVQRIYLDEIGNLGEQSLGFGIIQLVVESPNQAGDFARQLIAKTTTDLADVNLQQQVLELIETIVLYKFPNLSREDIEAMLGLSELKQTRVYQEAKEEGREEGREEATLKTKLAMIPKLRQLDLTAEEIAEFLELDLEIVQQHL